MPDEWKDVVTDADLFARIVALGDEYDLMVIEYPGYWNGDDAVALAQKSDEMPLVLVRIKDFGSDEDALRGLVRAWDEGLKVSAELRAMVEKINTTLQ